MSFLKNFLKNEEGQDMVEYTLLLAFVALAAGAVYAGIGGSIAGIWGTGNSVLVVANTTAK